jgi:hypothetical protein
MGMDGAATECAQGMRQERPITENEEPVSGHQPNKGQSHKGGG